MSQERETQLILDPWQKQVLETKGNIALRSGRQVGKSTIISILATEYAVNNKDKLIMIIAATERQALLMFEKVLGYMESKYRRLIKEGKDRPTKSKLQLKNGSTILSLPTGLTGYGIRGYTIDLLIADEAAFIPESVFAAITPALGTRKDSRIVLLSTPYGRRGYFYESFKDPTYTQFHISSEECSRWTEEALASEKARKTKLQYAQEILGEFIDDIKQFFPDELIKRCMTRRRTKEISEFKNYFLGVDIARMGKDESTFEIIELTEDQRIVHIDNQITTRTYLNETTKHILALDKIYNFKRVYLDDEGIGVGVYDHLLEQDNIKRKIVPINNSKRVLDADKTQRIKLLKEDLYNNLLRLMENGQIELLEDDEVFLSLKSVQYEYTSDSLGRSHLKIYGAYTHIAEGLIRACWCVKTKGFNIWIYSF